MLAPLLRARIVLVSCALSTNTPLCRQTINEEIQELDKTRGFGPSIKAYFKKLYRLYKTGVKTIDVKLFAEMLKRAIRLVENSVYYPAISSELSDLRPIITNIKQNLIEPIYQGNLDNILKNLDEINKVTMSCGNLNQFGNAKLRPFQLAQSYHNRVQGVSNIGPVYQRQAILYKRDIPSGSDLTDMETYRSILTGLCSELMASKRSRDDIAYDVASNVYESRDDTDERLRMMYEASNRDDASEQMITDLGYTQSQYNKLYGYVVSFDPTASHTRSISEERGRGIAACILLLDCIKLNAIKVPNIQAVCVKCHQLVDHVTEPERTAPYAGVIFVTGGSHQDDNRIGDVIERVINHEQGVRKSKRPQAGRQQPRVGPAMPAIDEEFELQRTPSRAGPELTLRPRAGSEGIELTSESPPSQVMSDNDSDNEASGAGVMPLLKSSKSSSGAAAKGKSNQMKGNSKKGGKPRKPMLRTRRRHKNRIQVTRNKKQTRILKVKNKRRYTRRHS